MAKFLYIVGGVVAEALGGALVVLLVAYSLYDPGPESWDFATPILVLGAMALAALLGGGLGAMAAINIADGQVRRGVRTFAGALAAVGILTLLAAEGLWAMIHMLVPSITEAQQAKEYASAQMYQRIATRVRFALGAEAGDRVIVRFDPKTMPGLARAVEQELQSQRVELLPYGPVDDFAARLWPVTGYVWLPTTVPTPADQIAALARWTDRGGRRREVHVHWMEGTLDLNGRQTAHPPGMDERYLRAAEVSPVELLNRMELVILSLTTGEVRVTTPAGTDIRFRVGDRPFNRQIGAARGVDALKIRIDRHTEVPPGVLRVAPLETSVNGVMAFPSFWIRDGVRATGVRLEFANGRITRVTAVEGQGELENYLRSQPALMHFREFCLGMNPQLEMQPGEKVIPYYGYGAGVVRMSLGDNEELGGTVRGGAVRWNFFTDATVVAGDRVVVRGGRLALQ